jgi:hypothetical protein
MQNYPQPGGPYSQAPPPPKSKTPWIIGGVVGCLFLIVAAIVVLGLIGYLASKGGVTRRASPEPTPPINTTPAVETKRFVNSREGRTGTLAENYIDFSFEYPATWQLDPTPEPSFVRVERTNEDGNTIENFSVGWFRSTGPAAGNRELLSQVVNKLSEQISGNFPGYTKASEGPATLGHYEGYELRFRGAANKGTANELPYWGRVVVLPDPGGDNTGASVIMLATGHSSEVGSLSDVGAKGELPIVINSFKLGK